MSLERKTPLRRTEFKRKAPMNTARAARTARPRARVRQVSERRTVEQREYDALRARLLPPGEWVPCELGERFASAGFRLCTGEATELNHRRKRSAQGALANPANVEPCCHSCNMLTEAEPDVAKELGIVVRPGHPEWDALSARAWRQR